MLVFVLVMAAFVGCAKPANSETAGTSDDSQTEAASPAADQLLNWNLGAEPKTLDPQLNSAADGGHVINNTFEGLFRHSGAEIIPAIADTYEVSEDGLVYTFNLKESKWSDGQPLTANDFEYAWKRALDPVTASEYSFQMYYIKGGKEFFEGTGKREDVAVVAVDDSTLQVTLVGPTPYFLDLLTFYTYMPVRQDIVEANPEGAWAIDPTKFVGNGPFVLTEYNSGSNLVLEKNPNYWNAENVKLTKIIAHMIVDESTQLTAYETGELDIIDTMPSAEIPRLAAEDATFVVKPQLGTYYYIFNVNADAVKDVRVRKALTLAIDRKAIVENVTKAGQIPATGFVPNGLFDADGNEFRVVAGDYGINPVAADIEGAKALLAEAGFPDGKGFPTLEILYNTSEGHKAIAEAIQEMWKKNLGIEVSIANQDWAVFQDSRHQGNFVVSRAGWLGDYADPMTFLDLWTSYSGNNDSQWKSTDYDALIEKSKVTTGKERFDTLYAAEKMMMDENIILPIYYYTDPFMVKEHVSGWEKTTLGHWYFGNIEMLTAE
jgi:oligopeptide transport system substrate-binding protein